MSYNSTGNPPMLITPAKLAPANAVGSTGMSEGGAIWVYNTTDESTAVNAANYFSNGLELGMRNGDVMILSGHTAEGSSGHYLEMHQIRGVSTSGASLSTGGRLIS